MKVQILLSSYNGEKYIKKQIDSLLNQNGIDISILIRDDGSIDSTTKILEDYSNRDNIKIIYGENIGVINSFFELISESSADVDYYALSDQDDFWLENKIIEAVKKIKKSKKEKHVPVLYSSKQILVNDDLDIIGETRCYRGGLSPYNAVVENVVTGCTTVFNKSARDFVRREKPKDVLMHDWWLYLVISSFGEVIFDTNSYIYYRQHDNNVVGYNNKGFKRIKQFYNRIRKRNFNSIRKQVISFYNLYKDDLNPELKKDLQYFIDSKSNILYRLKIIFGGRFYRHGVYDNIIFKLLLLLNLI